MKRQPIVDKWSVNIQTEKTGSGLAVAFITDSQQCNSSRHGGNTTVHTREGEQRFLPSSCWASTSEQTESGQPHRAVEVWKWHFAFTNTVKALKAFTYLPPWKEKKQGRFELFVQDVKISSVCKEMIRRCSVRTYCISSTASSDILLHNHLVERGEHTINPNIKNPHFSAQDPFNSLVLS